VALVCRYSRLISGFEEKIRNHKDYHRVSGFSEEQFDAGGFSAFVAAIAKVVDRRTTQQHDSIKIKARPNTPNNPKKLLERIQRWKRLNVSLDWGRFSGGVDAHFNPLTEHCMLPRGMQYDFFLKTEEISEWYEPFARYLGIVDVLQQGWDVDSKWHVNPDLKPCFFLKKGCNSCSGMFATGSAQVAAGCDAASFALAKGDSENLPASHHAASSVGNVMLTGAALIESEFDLVSAKIVSEMWFNDFEQMGYPVWDGISPFVDTRPGYSPGDVKSPSLEYR
jgi:hypothetical protein